jgi:hypothetical protein
MQRCPRCCVAPPAHPPRSATTARRCGNAPATARPTAALCRHRWAGPLSGQAGLACRGSHGRAPRATGHLIDLSIFFGGDGIRELLDEVIFGTTKMVGPTDGLNPFY